MSEWKEYKLGEHINVINGFAFKSINFLYEKRENTLPIIKIKNVANGDVNLKEVQYHHYDEKLSNFVAKKGDILLALTGNHPQVKTQVVGETSRYKLSDPALVNQRVAKIEPKKSLDKDFLYYFLKQDDTHDYLANQSSGSANQANISKADIENIEILMPELDEQQQIASVLSSLDDKIDLLHRQNKTLEQLTETLFRQWFIEEAEEQSEKQLQLGDLIESVSITHKFPYENVIFLNTSDILTGDVLVHESVNINTLPGQAKKTIQKDDILFSEIRPANGRYAYVDFDADNYVVSTKLMVLRSKNIISQAFIYFYLINPQTVEWLQMLAESRSGTFPQITFEQLRNLKINIPSDSILKESVEWCKSALQKIKSNTKQIRTLTQLRDTLLPKLMSGEVRVS